MEFGWLNYAIIITYLIGMLGIGILFSGNNTTDKFFNGEKQIPWWAAGISIYATMLSPITYIAIPAKSYHTNWTYYPLILTLLPTILIVTKYYIPRLRHMNITSVYEYMEIRFNTAIRFMTSSFFALFMVTRMAIVLYIPSIILSKTTNIDAYTFAIMIGIITTAYSTAGGIKSVIFGDVIQGAILVAGTLYATYYLWINTDGGPLSVLEIAYNDGKMQLFDCCFDYKKASFWVVILGGFANNIISYTSDQTVVQRYLVTKDKYDAKRSIWLNTVMSICISALFYAIGTGLYAFYKTHPQCINTNTVKGDEIFPFFIMQQMPQGVSGLMIAAILAAAMSTISSSINSVATTFSVDFWKKIKPLTTDKNLIYVSKITSAICGMTGLCIALLMLSININSLFDLFNSMLGLISSGIGGLFIMGMFFKNINARDAMIGFITGEIITLIIYFFTDTSFLLYGFIGMATTTVTGLTISKINKKMVTTFT